MAATAKRGSLRDASAQYSFVDQGGVGKSSFCLRMKQSDKRIKTSETVQPGSPSLWRPLRTAVFRNLLVADVISDIGTFMQSVGAAWLMVSLNGGPMLVALRRRRLLFPSSFLRFQRARSATLSTVAN